MDRFLKDMLDEYSLLCPVTGDTIRFNKLTLVQMPSNSDQTEKHIKRLDIARKQQREIINEERTKEIIFIEFYYQLG